MFFLINYDYLIIFLIVWSRVFPLPYNKVKWESSKFERFHSCIWPLLLPLYLIPLCSTTNFELRNGNNKESNDSYSLVDLGGS